MQTKLEKREFASAQAFVIDLQVSLDLLLLRLRRDAMANSRLVTLSTIQLVFQNAMHCEFLRA